MSSCTVCPPDTECLHVEHTQAVAILNNGQADKVFQQDDKDKETEQSSSADASEHKLGFMRYFRKCFKSRFRGNSSLKLRSKLRRASTEPTESVSTLREVTPVIEKPQREIPNTEVSVEPSQTKSLEREIPNTEVSVEPSQAKSLEREIPNTEVCVEPSQTKSLAVELLNLSKYGWYWGPITLAEAVEKLSDQPDGSFLVRDSYADHCVVSMSFRSLGKIYHTRISHTNGYFSFYNSPKSCTSIPELIELSMDSSKSSVFCYSRPRCPISPSLPVRLTRPVSRFTQVRSLKYLCRFVIRQYTRIDQIRELPLPTSLCGYIEEKQF